MWNRKYHAKHKVFSLYGHLLDLNRLTEAWTKVKQNDGAGGVDKITIEMFERQHDLHLRTLRRRLQNKTYTPSPVRRVQIEKEGSSKVRNLGIPTILDRVLQQALKDLLEPIFEPIFSDRSFGYRPGRSAHDALDEVKRLREDHDWIVDADIKGFFDNVDHEILLDFVNEQVSDGSILRLIRSILNSGVSFEGVILPTEKGTPQGGVISPLLANIYLNHLDRRLEEEGYAFVRYADDFLIFCTSRGEAETALGFVHDVVSTDLDLELSPEKTQVCCIHRDEDSTIPKDLRRPFEFLGFIIHKWWMIPNKRAVKRFKSKMRGLTIRHCNYQTDTWIPRLNSVIRGWSNYYRIGTVKTLFKKLSRWIRIRMRMVFLRRRYRKVRLNRGTLLPSYYTYTNSFFMELGLITPEELL